MADGLAGSKDAEQPVPKPHSCKGLHASADTKASGAIPVPWSSELQEEAECSHPLRAADQCLQQKVPQVMVTSEETAGFPPDRTYSHSACTVQ